MTFPRTGSVLDRASARKGNADDLPTLSIELTPYYGTGNPPFRLLQPGEEFRYPLPSGLHRYARPTHSPRQRHFEHDLARIVVATGARTVPFAFRDACGVAHRMCASAIDFAAANVFIASPYRGPTPVAEITVIGDLDAALAFVPTRRRGAGGSASEAQGRLALA